MTSKRSTSLLILVIAGLMLTVAGCSDNDVTTPAPGTIVIAEDPLDDVLKSTDGRTPADPRESCSRLGEVLGLGEARHMAVAHREAFEAEMQMIMTAEQWDMLQDMRHEGRREEGHHGGGFAS